MAALTRLRARLSSESGAELVEFAVTLPLLLLIVLGIVECGLIFREYEVVTNAAREGARIAILQGGVGGYDDDDVVARVDEYLSSAGMNSTMWAVDPGDPVPTPVGGGGACVSMVPVTVTYDHPVLFLSGIANFFGTSIGTLTLTATSSMRTEISAGACP